MSDDRAVLPELDALMANAEQMRRLVDEYMRVSVVARQVQIRRLLSVCREEFGLSEAGAAALLESAHHVAAANALMAPQESAA